MTKSWPLLLALLSFGFAETACQGGPQLDSRTNWFSVCREKADCSDDEAACSDGVCAKTCTALGTCAELAEAEYLPKEKAATAVHEEEAPASEVPDFPECVGASDCQTDEICLNGACTKTSLPTGSDCEDVVNWDPEAERLESHLLGSLNQRRTSEPLACSSSPQPPLTFDPRLRCAARLHALDMVVLNYYSEFSPTGLAGKDWIVAAGYLPTALAVTVSHASDPTAFLAEVAKEKSADCTNIGDPAYQDVGIGFFAGTWSVIYASP